MTMKKTIAIIASLDSKEQEVGFVRDFLTRLGHGVLLIDVGVRSHPGIVPDISREAVLEAAGAPVTLLETGQKHERLAAMARGAARLAAVLYGQGRFDALFALGGVQNTIIGTSAMKALPYGVPKLVVSTVASGNRTFEPLVGTKDILLLPSIADIAGLNSVTRMVLSNAAAALAGMVEHAGAPLRAGTRPIVGATMMGISGDGVARAAGLVERAGYEVISFHTTGVGGRVLEELIDQGFIRAALDLTLHEITAEYFGGGFSAGASGRLLAAARAGIPLVVAPGGLDFIDFGVRELPADIDSRKYILHNSEIAHIKIHPAEMIPIAERVVERLNQCSGPVTLLIPERGFRQAAAPGEPLYDPEVDAAFTQVVAAKLKPGIRVVKIDANINDPAFSAAAADALLELLGK